MNCSERRHKILEKVEIEDFVDVIKLAEIYNVSDVTIRNDLKVLERQGFLERTHGGASKVRNKEYYPSISAVSSENLMSKKMIATEAVKLISDGDVIMIDVSSTCGELAKCIKKQKFQNLVIITNSFRTHAELMNVPGIELIFLGGRTNNQMECTNGEMTINMVNNLFADKTFLGTNGIDLKAGVTACNFEETAIKKAMIANSTKSYLLVDHSKFGKTNIALVSNFESFDRIITDNRVPKDYIDALGDKLLVSDDIK